MRMPKSDTKKRESTLVGTRIREIRKEAGLSLQDLADRMNRDFNANINKGMISKYENGIHEPSAGTVYCLAKIFGISAEYITGRSDERQSSSQPEKDREGLVLKIYTRYNPSDGGETENGTTELIPSQWAVGGHEFFGYRVIGSDFAPRYYDGDLIVFERTGRVQRDRVGLVSIGTNDAFLCHIVRKRTGKSFIPLDRRCDELFFTTEQLEASDIQVHGAAGQVRRME